MMPGIHFRRAKPLYRWFGIRMDILYWDSTIRNPYRRLVRNPTRENRWWNNRKNKYKIRIMWKEYCEKWRPWFTPKNSPGYLHRCCVESEERQAYNVFRYYLTERKFYGHKVFALLSGGPGAREDR